MRAACLVLAAVVLAVAAVFRARAQEARLADCKAMHQLVGRLCWLVVLDPVSVRLGAYGVPPERGAAPQPDVPSATPPSYAYELVDAANGTLLNALIG